MNGAYMEDLVKSLNRNTCQPTQCIYREFKGIHTACEESATDLHFSGVVNSFSTLTMFKVPLNHHIGIGGVDTPKKKQRLKLWVD